MFPPVDVQLPINLASPIPSTGKIGPLLANKTKPARAKPGNWLGKFEFLSSAVLSLYVDSSGVGPKFFLI